MKVNLQSTIQHQTVLNIFFIERSFYFKNTFKQHDLSKRHYLKLIVWNNAMWYRRGNFKQFFFRYLNTKIKILRNRYP
jgi:hypothetical protein